MADPYRLSFTTGGLFIQESPPVAELFLMKRDWQEARDQVREMNLLQVRTAAAATRISKEIVARLEHLDVGELEALVEGTGRIRDTFSGLLVPGATPLSASLRWRCFASTY